ncbi:gliding motility-associated C-terminal domain-containing protein [Chitinophaga sp. CF118]|uniref:T9SS type B sorting domain-containing protein n=1 Tax=Chitinophaga sp. CF118 TaxID=1884367 RepID=UPI0015A50482|nr:gliding motility-associated C-terminal domain-containing protein [Chitinophaga sp. CF118]
MNQFYKTILTLFCVLTSLNSYADGSKDLYPSGIPGQRAYLISTNNSVTAGWPFTTLGVHYVYANPGETVAAASSTQGLGLGQIILTAPDGTVYSSTVGSSAVGRIVNRTQELQGPFVGYTPFTQLVGSTQGGIWKVELLSCVAPGINNSAGATGNADANWTQNTTGSTIAAWDVSVISAASALIPGRVYATVMNMYVTTGNYYGKLYVQTSDGYTYKINNNGLSGIGFVFFVNNKGITTGTGDAAPPSYKSLNSTASIPTKDPRTADGTLSITQKIFYTTPDPGLPATAPLPGGGTTWLKVTKIIPTVSSVAIEGVEGTSGQVSSKGAYVKFNANTAGTFRITLSGASPFVTRTIIGSAVSGNNSVFWDGKDGAGTAPSLGTAAITANVQLQGAEVHFPFIDVEQNPNGTIIEQLNDDGSVKSDVVYWDDSAFPTVTGASNPQFNGNSGNGISSNTNGHKWSSNYGNDRTMDTWTYILGDIVSENTVLNIRQADLEVQSVAPSTPITQVAAGQTVTYNVAVINNGPSDVTGAPFKFKVPAGFTIENISDVIATSGCGTLNSSSIDVSGNYTALLDLPNGCVFNFSVTGKAGASLAGNSINIEVSIMRPNDVTDPDATNPNASVPPTDPHVECLNGTATESCNNIKYNTSVAVTASADIVTVKTTKNASQATFVPGDAVVYTITVTNNGPSDATNVNIIDAAPTGTTISSWTASVSTGTVTLPSTSGTGNLNETIATLPNGAVVSYEITVQTPSDFNSNLSNIVAVTSSTTDPDPACPACTTTPITPAPSADIVTMKTTKNASQTSFVPGDAVVYTITVTNNGPSDATNVNIVDAAPAGTTISSWTASVTTGMVTLPSTSGTGNLDQIITTLPNGAVVNYEVTVQTPVTFSSNLSNTVAVTSATTDPDPACTACSTTPITPILSADIVTVKTTKNTSQTSFVPGESVVYTITVTNNGPSDATNVNIVDAAPAGTTISNWTASVTTGTVILPNISGTGNLNETIASLPNGAVVSYEVTVQTPSTFSSSLNNTVAVTSATPDPVPACTSCTTTSITPAPSADIVTVKTTKNISQTTFVPGENVVYTITITNNGPSDATNVNIVDAAPAGTTIGSWTASVTTGTVILPNTSGTGDLNETIASLPNGAVVSYEVTVQTPITFSSNLNNTVAVTSATPDPVPVCTNCTTTSITPGASADIVTVKTTKNTSQTTFVPGDAVVYTITVTNNGPSDATNVNILDAAPAGTTISSWTASVTTGTVILPNISGTGDLNETIASLPNGAVVSYEVTVQTPSTFSSSLNNTVAVTSATPDPVPACTNCTTTSITPAPSADIVTVKTTKNTSQTTFVPGDAVIYTITVTNNGPSNATNVNIVDAAPTGTTISSWTATVFTGTVTLPNTSGTGNLNETIANLPNGAVVSYEVMVQTPITFSSSLSNTVAVTSTTPDPVPACTNCTTISITPVVIPPIASTDNVNNIIAGNNITIPVLDNDSPGQGGSPIVPASLEIVEQPEHGTIKINQDGTVVYTPDQGYSGTDTFTYRVKDEAGNWSNVATVSLNIVPSDLEVPNVITPNGDGNNDKLVIKGLEKYSQNEVIIFNRWNNVLYKGRNYAGDWDGNGLNAGTYYYTLKVQEANGQWHTHNGYIMLLR